MDLVDSVTEVVVEWELDRESGLTLSAWDFPAGEIYTNRFFLTDRAVYFVCFDANKYVCVQVCVCTCV